MSKRQNSSYGYNPMILQNIVAQIIHIQQNYLSRSLKKSGLFFSSAVGTEAYFRPSFSHRESGCISIKRKTHINAVACSNIYTSERNERK